MKFTHEIFLGTQVSNLVKLIDFDLFLILVGNLPLCHHLAQY